MKSPSNGILPIGSIYLSLTADNPATLFGGTWQQIKDTFLLAAGDIYAANSTGGASSHTHTTGDHAITIAQMPSHQHQTPFVGNEIADGSYTDGHYNFLYGKGQTASAMGQKTEMFNSDSNNQAEGNEYAYMTNWTGSSQAHNHGNTGASSNMPPYITVRIWERVA